MEQITGDQPFGGEELRRCRGKYCIAEAYVCRECLLHCSKWNTDGFSGHDYVYEMLAGHTAEQILHLQQIPSTTSSYQCS
jgi:hypothetical protein